MDWTMIIGIAGAFLMLLAFTLNELHILDRDSLTYDGMNFIGGALLTTYAWLLASIPFFILNAAWTLVALRDVVNDLRK